MGETMKQSDFDRPYVKVFKDITHWHEHEIHGRISAVLGINTWEISNAKLADPHTRDGYHLDLTINFPTREDYERCVSTIIAVLQMEPC